MPCLSPIRVLHPRLRSERAAFKADAALYGMDHWTERAAVYGCSVLIDVPCGHCIECIKKERRDWKFRLLSELAGSRNAIFVTLTFSDRYYLNSNNSIQDYVTRFLDRWRKIYGSAPKRFFVTELGEKNGRLHLHGIIYNVPFYISATIRKSYTKMNRKLKKIWQYGNTWVGYCTEQTVGYVVKYIFKERMLGGTPLVKDNTFRTDDYKTTKFVSPGLGKDALTNEQISKLKLYGHLLASVSGYTYAVPRYFRNKYCSRKSRLLFELTPLYSDPPPGRSYVWGSRTFADLDSRERYLETRLQESRRLGFGDVVSCLARDDVFRRFKSVVTAFSEDYVIPFLSN